MNARAFLVALISALIENANRPLPTETLARTNSNQLVELCGCSLCSPGDYPLGNPDGIVRIDSRIIEFAEEDILVDGDFPSFTCTDVEYWASVVITQLSSNEEGPSSIDIGDFAPPAFEWFFQLDPNVRKECGCPKLSKHKCKLPSALCFVPQLLFPVVLVLQRILLFFGVPVLIKLFPILVPGGDLNNLFS